MSTYHIKIQIKDFRLAKIQRTVLADGSLTFFDLHYAICQMMGFGGYHLRDFELRSKGSITLKITCPQDPEDDHGDMRGWSMPETPKSTILTYHSQKTSLDDILPTYPKLLYCYDYSDDRQFTVHSKRVDTAIPDASIICIQTSGGSLIEDCGGTAGLTDWIELYQAGKWDKDSFDSKKEFVDALKPYLSMYQIQPLQDSRQYRKDIQKMINQDRGIGS